MKPLFEEVAPLREASRHVVRELGFLGPEPLESGITHSQCHTLVELERHGVLTLGDLSEKLRLDKSTLSRTVTQLLERGLVKQARANEDRRVKPLTLTEKGRRQLETVHQRANGQVQEALILLSEPERRTVLEGMRLYGKALARARALQQFTLRAIEPSDDAEVARLIRTVMPEFGASGPGFAIHDPEVDHMTKAYRGKRSVYFVLLRGVRIVGGGGIAPLVGGDDSTCELRKMYFLPEVRGLGLGRLMLDRCLKEAEARGFKRCYLETLKHMTQARALYEKNGFRRIDKPMGATGHFGCDAWYVRPLSKRS